jgi:hypothetical protein
MAAAAAPKRPLLEGRKGFASQHFDHDECASSADATASAARLGFHTLLTAELGSLKTVVGTWARAVERTMDSRRTRHIYGSVGCDEV